MIGIFILFVYMNIIEGHSEEGSYIYRALNQEVTQMTIGFIVVLAVFLTLLVHLAGRRWKAESNQQGGQS